MRITRGMGLVFGSITVAAMLSGCGAEPPEFVENPDAVEEAIEDLIGDLEVDDDGIPEFLKSPPGSGEFGRWSPDNLAPPSCDDITAGMGADLAGFELIVDSGLEIHEGPMPTFGVSCAWMHDEGREAVDNIDLTEWGGLSMSINVTVDPLTAEDSALANFYYEDERVEEHGGYVFAPATMDPGDQLGIIGVGVSLNGVDVHWGVGTPFLNDVSHLASYTNDWAITAGLAVHDLIWD